MLPASRRLRPGTLLLVLALMVPAAAVVSLVTGPVSIPLSDLGPALTGAESTSGSANTLIVRAIRVPRMLLGALVGLILALCGAAMQGLFRNPLADPSLIGVTSGASAGASFVIVLGGGWLAGHSAGLPLVGLGASLGGFLAVLLVYRVATSASGTAVQSMLLAGIAISALAAAINSLFSYFADNEMLRRISLWQMGSLDSASWDQVGLSAFIAAALLVVLPRDSRALNALLLGESEARHLGIDVERLKRRLIVATALGVGTTVAIAGVIAFVGLLVPHFVRLLIGPDHRFVLPAAGLAGAILILLADALARIIVAPAELPTGVLTALLGAPLFFTLLVRMPLGPER